MKRLGIAILLAVFVASPALAGETRDNLALTQSIIEVERKMIVANNLSLTDEQSKAFWPVYDEFQVALRKLNDKRANLILDLAKEFETLDGDRSQEMLKTSLKIEADRTKLKTKYIKKFNKVLPPKTVVRYFQIENKLDSVINYELAGIIPLVRPDVAAPQK